MTLGEQLKQAREKKNFSQEELADYLGVSRQAVSKWENNLAVPQGHNMDVLQKVLELECSPKQEPSSEEPLPEEGVQKKKRRGFVAAGWIASVLAAALLGKQLSGQLQAQPVGKPNDTEQTSESGRNSEGDAQPELYSVRFYDENQVEVAAKDGVFNTAVIDSILIQWKGTAENLQIYYRPRPEHAEKELIATKKLAGEDCAVLLNASVLGQWLEGEILFELGCGGESVWSEPYGICWDTPTTLAYIKKYDGGKLIFDEVEWVEVPSDRATELGIADAGGFYIHNEREALESFPLAQECVYTVLDWENNYEPTTVTLSRFLELLEEREENRIPYNLGFLGGKITSVTEHYIP